MDQPRFKVDLPFYIEEILHHFRIMLLDASFLYLIAKNSEISASRSTYLEKTSDEPANSEMAIITAEDSVIYPSPSSGDVHANLNRLFLATNYNWEDLLLILDDVFRIADLLSSAKPNMSTSIKALEEIERRDILRDLLNRMVACKLLTTFVDHKSGNIYYHLSEQMQTYLNLLLSATRVKPAITS